MIITITNALFIILCCIVAKSFVWFLQALIKWRHKLVSENLVYTKMIIDGHINKSLNQIAIKHKPRREKMEDLEVTQQEIDALNSLCQKVHTYAKKQGWWERDRSQLEIHALLHSEISEATEEVRKGMPDVYQVRQALPGTKAAPTIIEPHEDSYLNWSDMDEGETIPKPEGEAIEIVDVLIRAFDYSGRKNWKIGDLVAMKHKFNMTRGYRHGGKKY